LRAKHLDGFKRGLRGVEDFVHTMLSKGEGFKKLGFRV